MIEALVKRGTEKRLRTAAEGWLVLADIMGRQEASLLVAHPAE